MEVLFGLLLSGDIGKSDAGSIACAQSGPAAAVIACLAPDAAAGTKEDEQEKE
jgi:hypothetical protein